MTGFNKDDELLSAYIDGELDAADAARLAQSIATDEALARRVAALAEVRSALAGLAQEVVVVTVPQRRRILPGILAATLIGCLGLLIVALPLMRDVPDQQDQGLADAVALHDAWLTAEAQPAAVPNGDLFGAEMAIAGLSPAFLHDAAVINGQTSLHAGFVGRKGCRISIFRLTAPPDIEEGFMITSDGAVQRAGWRDRAFTYLLIARGMDETRFIMIADLLRKRPDPSLAVPDTDAIAALSGPQTACRV